MLIDSIATNLKKEAKELLNQVKKNMYEVISLSENEYKKEKELCKDFILRQTFLLCSEKDINKPDPELKKRIKDYLIFKDLRKMLNLEPKIVFYEEEEKESVVPEDFKELLNKIKENLLNTLPNTKYFEPTLKILNEILDDKYLDKGFINTLYIEEDLAFDIFNFQKRYSLYENAKNIFNKYEKLFLNKI